MNRLSSLQAHTPVGQTSASAIKASRFNLGVLEKALQLAYGNRNNRLWQQDLISFFQFKKSAAIASLTGTLLFAILPSSAVYAQDAVIYKGTANPTATGTGSLAAGTGIASGLNSIAIGNNATSSNTNAYAIGTNANADAAGALAFGVGTNNLANNGIAIGFGARLDANSTNSIALGTRATLTTAANSIVLGNTAAASASEAVVIGTTAKSDIVGSVTLGAASVGVANEVTNGTVASTDMIKINYNNSTNVAIGAVSVGSATALRQIKNLADGSAPTDAVTIRQLSSVASQASTAITTLRDETTTAITTLRNETTSSITTLRNDTTMSITNLGNDTAAAIGGGSTYNATTGRLSPPTINVGGQTYTSVSEAIGRNAADIATNTTNLNNATTMINSGNLKYIHTTSDLADATAGGTNSTAIGPLAMSSGASSIAMGNGALAITDNSVALGAQSLASREIVASAGTIAAGSTVIHYDTTDNPLLGEVAVGSKTAGYRQITGVADATQDHDAITLRQLRGALTTLTTGGNMRYFHVNSTLADSITVGTNAIAIGSEGIANGDDSIIIGTSAASDGSASGGIAIGRMTNVGGPSAIALGSLANAAAEQTLALGAGSQALLVGDVALGGGSTAERGAETYTGRYSGLVNLTAGTVSVGSIGAERTLSNVADARLNTDAVNLRQLIGAVTDAVAQAQEYTDTQVALASIGGNAGAEGNNGNNSSSYGPDSNAKGDSSTSIGAGSNADGDKSSAIGPGSNAGGDSSSAIGPDSNASGDRSTAIGPNSNAGGNNSNAIGPNSNAGGNNSNVIGPNSNANGDSSTAIGPNSNAGGNNSNAIGPNSNANGDSSTAIGPNSNAGGNNSNAIGPNSNASGDSSTAIGPNSNASGNHSNAIGPNSNAGGDSSTAIGPGSNAGGDSSTAIGPNSNASGNSSTAIGPNSNASGQNSTAVGANSQSSGMNSGAFGAGSNDGGRNNVISIGSPGNERILSNVADGVRSTDAVNLGQFQRGLAELKHDANGGIATAIALGSLGQPTKPDKVALSLGYGVHSNQSAIAIGISRLTANENWIFKGALSTNSRGATSAGVSATLQW